MEPTMIADTMISDDTMGLIGLISTISNIIGLVGYLAYSWGLFTINKKFGEAYPWLAFIPLVQLYALTKAAGVKFVEYIVIPFVSIFVLAIIGGILAAMVSPIFMIMAFIGYFYFLYKYINLLHHISKRTGRGAWTTVGLLFVGAIMFPVVGYKLKDQSGPKSQEPIIEEV